MKMKLIAAATLAASSTLFAQNGTPWTPPKKTAYVTLTAVYDSFREFRKGPTPAVLPGSLIQKTFFGSVEYGITKRLSADLQTGFSRTKHLQFGLDGIVDTSIGARFRVVNTERQVFTLRGAGIVAGSYPLTNLGPFAPGFKANGYVGSALYGVLLPKRVYASVEAGYNGYSMPVRDRVFGNIVVGHSIHRWSYFGGYQTSRGLSGWDLFAPGFTPIRRNQTKRILGAMDLGGGYTFKKDVYIGASYGRFLHGRNVGVKNAFAVTLGFTLPVRN